MKITDKDFYWHLSWVKGREAQERVRDMVAYLHMGGYHFPTENPMREVQRVVIKMEQGSVWDWETNLWVRKEKTDEVV